MNLDTLKATAQAMTGKGRGILAMDESHGTCNKRFEALGIPTTPEMRREYRSMLVTAPGIGNHFGGAILFDETLRDKTTGGKTFVEVLNSQGIAPGIKVDAGAKDLALGEEGETVTEGLDGLRERMQEYGKLGARFAKWRAVYKIGEYMPTQAAVSTNAHALARYAAICQENNIVPIVEPEVLINGTHSIEQCYEKTQYVQQAVFAALAEQGVALEGIVLKPSMVISGDKATSRAGVDQVAAMTLRCLLSTVPSSVPGIAFLSGGQSDEEATAHLNAMNKAGPHPWNVTFSYGRALQHAAMTAWAGKKENIDKAGKIVGHRAAMNGAAALGKWSAAMEKAA